VSVKKIARNATHISKGKPDRRASVEQSRVVRRGGIAGEGGLAKGLEKALQGALGGKRRRRR
jgi:hypothetical protein